MEKFNSDTALRHAQSLPSWKLDAAAGTIDREFVFADFVQAFSFMTEVALAAEKHHHHPEWSNGYRTVIIRFTTHDAGGLTSLDFIMANLAEKAYGRFAPQPGREATQP